MAITIEAPKIRETNSTVAISDGFLDVTVFKPTPKSRLSLESEAARIQTSSWGALSSEQITRLIALYAIAVGVADKLNAELEKEDA